MLLIGSMVFFIACSEDFSTVSLLEYNGQFPEESAKHITITLSDSGITSFTIYAPVFNKYLGDSSYTDCPNGVEVTSFDHFGNKQSVLTADYAISRDKTEVMEAHKNVVITDLQKNETIETEKIIWDKKKKRIYSDVMVKQIKADGSINIGDGFDADERFTQYSIRKPRGEMVTNEL